MLRAATSTDPTACASFMICSWSQRSAATPAKGAITTAGNRSANAITPSQVVEPVSSQVSQPVAILCVQVPISDTQFPMVKSRKFGSLSERTTLENWKARAIRCSGFAANPVAVRGW